MRPLNKRASVHRSRAAFRSVPSLPSVALALLGVLTWDTLAPACYGHALAHRLGEHRRQTKQPAEYLYFPAYFRDSQRQAISQYKQAISQYKIASTGQLVPLKPSVVYSGVEQDFVLADPHGLHLYVRSSGIPTYLSQYRIGADGRLTPLKLGPLRIPDGAGNAVIDVSGRFLYLVDAHAQALHQYRVQPSGTLTPLPAPSLPLPALAVRGDFYPFLVANPASELLYTAQGTGKLLGYRIRADGTLQPLGETRVSARFGFIRAAALTPDGRYLVVSGDRLLCYRILPGGDVRLLPRNAPVLRGADPSLAITPDCKFLYAGFREFNSEFTPNMRTSAILHPLSAYRLSPDGVTLISDKATADLGIPHLGVAPSGRYLYASGVDYDDKPSLYQFRIGSDGRLSPLTPPLRRMPDNDFGEFVIVQKPKMSGDTAR